LDSRAQASSVFQLLISAIVAAAVLMILLQVLGIINFGFNQDPAKAASDLLKDAWNNPATIKTSTSNVTFTTALKQINSIALAQGSKVGIASEQICLSLGDFSEKDNSLFVKNESGNAISYTGSSNKDARLSVFCYTGEQALETLKSLEDNAGTWETDGDNCGACFTSTETCCIVALRTEKR